MIGSRAVFQVPDIGADAYQLSERRKAEAEREKSRRERDVSSFDAESSFYSADMSKISPTARPLVKEAFDIWKSASVDYLASGSDSDKKRMQEAYRQFSGIFGGELARSQNLSSIVSQYEKEDGKGFADSRDEFRAKVEGFRNMPINYTKNGERIFIDGQEWGEYGRYLTEANELNFPDIRAVDPRSRHMDTDRAASDMHKIYRTSTGVFTRTAEGDFYNTEAFLKKIDGHIDNELNKKDFLEAVYISHHLKTEGGVDPNSMSRSEINQIVSNYSSNKSLSSEAVDSYRREVKEKAADMLNADKPFISRRKETDKDPLKGGQFGFQQRVGKDSKKLMGIDAYTYNWTKPVKISHKGVLYKVDGIVFNPDGSIRSLRGSTGSSDDLDQQLDKVFGSDIDMRLVISLFKRQVGDEEIKRVSEEGKMKMNKKLTAAAF